MLWTTEALDRAERVLTISTDRNNANQQLEEEFGQPELFESVRRAFHRHGRGRLQSLLKKPEGESARVIRLSDRAVAGTESKWSNVARFDAEYAAQAGAARRRNHSVAKPGWTPAGTSAAGAPDDRSGNLKRILFIPDVHRPYHSEAAWQLALKVGENFRPDIVVTLGDFGDFFCTSQHRHKPSPLRSMDLEKEIESCNQGFDELEQATPTATQRIAIEGNHEENLERYLTDRAPELFNLVTLEKQFRLADRGYEFVRYRNHTMIGKLLVTHDLGVLGPQAHVRSQAAAGCNVVIGHCHRLAVSYISTILGESHLAAMFGWLGDPVMAEYMYRAKTRDWMHAVGIGYMESNGNVHVSGIPFINGSAMVEGRLIR